MKKVTTLISWDMNTGQVLDHQYYDYSGTWELCKGENKQGMAASQQQMALQNKLAGDQLQQQKKFSGPVYDSLLKYLTSDIGFSPEQAAAMTSQFLDQQSQRFAGAQRGVTTNLLRRGSGGGDNPVGGDYTRGIAALKGMEASSTSSGLRDINLANIQQSLANKFNTASTFMGYAPSLGNQAVGFSGNAGQALGQYVDASKPQPSPWFGVLGAALGAAGTAAAGHH